MKVQALALRLSVLVVAVRKFYPYTLAVSDLVGFVPAFLFAGLLRDEVVPTTLKWSEIAAVAAVAALSMIVVGWVLHLYRNRYRVSSFDEVATLGTCWIIATAVATVANRLLFAPRVSTLIVATGMVFAGGWMVATRVFWRFLKRAESRPDPEGRVRVLVFGAGDGGTQVVQSMLSDGSSQYVPVGLIDDDVRKKNRIIEGVPVVGTSADLYRHRNLADMLLIAVPSASSALVSRLAEDAGRAELDVMILPTTTDLFGSMVNMEAARPLEVSDLLGRDEVEIDNVSVGNYLRDSVVLVTGAGGSIGSELCRQILRFEPKRLVMLDRDETALQGVQLSIAGHGLLNDDNLVLADIRDRDRVFEVFEQHRPAIVFHAAALKHLPLLESHPREGLLTNVFGSKNVLEAAQSVGVKRYVNVSTDKAANPTSVLGTTKRLAEALTVETGSQADGQFINVRFGNVIGSRGSVLPAFEQQIAAGGPVTVTHRDVTRFFMSIPEASRLVLQAGAIGVTGETLVLDMGEPMKIVDLAEKLIRHHNSDAEIVFTGLRPNEKLHEVLGHDGETMVIGTHPRIWHAAAVVAPVTHQLDILDDTPKAELALDLMAVVDGWKSNNSSTPPGAGSAETPVG